jgi:hypothetical protein
MKRTTQILIPTLLAGVALAGTALLPQAAQAQGRVFRGAGGPQYVPGSGFANGAHPLRGSLTWSGNVDDTVVVEIHRGDAHTRIVHGKDVTNANIQFDGRLPDRPVNVRLRDWHGRGEVRVVQEPNAGNDYTATVRIHDPKGGSGHYTFTLAWHDGDHFPGDRF